MKIAEKSNNIAPQFKKILDGRHGWFEDVHSRDHVTTQKSKLKYIGTFYKL